MCAMQSRTSFSVFGNSLITCACIRSALSKQTRNGFSKETGTGGGDFNSSKEPSSPLITSDKPACAVCGEHMCGSSNYAPISARTTMSGEMRTPAVAPMHGERL